MKAALIPPIPELKYFGHGDFHLLLSHLLVDPVYFAHYEEQRKRGAYLVLDNSAHEEGAGDDPEALLFNALAIKAQELVVPDVLDDGPATVDRSCTALETWFEGTTKVNSNLIHQLSPALMYVPQGRDLLEWHDCLCELIRIHLYVATKYEYRPGFVIGISKDYEKWGGGLLRLLDEYIQPLRKRLEFQVHMLGWGRDLWALSKIKAQHPWIRSTDSAKPFVYAGKSIDLWGHFLGLPPAYPTRPDNYFSKALTPRRRVIAYSNVQLFQSLARGTIVHG